VHRDFGDDARLLLLKLPIGYFFVIFSNYPPMYFDDVSSTLSFMSFSYLQILLFNVSTSVYTFFESKETPSAEMDTYQTDVFCFTATTTENHSDFLLLGLPF
jgi:hypothetical protein